MSSEDEEDVVDDCDGGGPSSASDLKLDERGFPIGTAAIALSLYTVLHPEVRRVRRQSRHEVETTTELPRPPQSQ
jgi:hypothetical protein